MLKEDAPGGIKTRRVVPRKSHSTCEECARWISLMPRPALGEFRRDKVLLADRKTNTSAKRTSGDRLQQCKRDVLESIVIETAAKERDRRISSLGEKANDSLRDRSGHR